MLVKKIKNMKIFTIMNLTLVILLIVALTLAQPCQIGGLTGNVNNVAQALSQPLPDDKKPVHEEYKHETDYENDFVCETDITEETDIAEETDITEENGITEEIAVTEDDVGYNRDNHSIEPRLMANTAIDSGSLSTVSSVSSINMPLGGNTIKPGDEDSLVVMEAGDPNGYYKTYTANEAGLRSALWHLYTAETPDKSYIMYFGATLTTSLPLNLFANTPSATAPENVTFACLSGRVDTLVLTGTLADEITEEPAGSGVPPASVGGFTASVAGNKYFGCNIILRNIRHNFETGAVYGVYMNGYDLTLGGNSWQLSLTRYFGGSSAGTVTPKDGTASITVYSTGIAESHFIGGMLAGTLNGNTEVTIHNTSGNIICVYGGGIGKAANKAHVTGSVTNTITGMATGSGGLMCFLGGVEYGNITGKITNTISGKGRFLNEGHPTSGWGAELFAGGSRAGNVGIKSSEAAALGIASTEGGPVNTQGLESDYSSLAETEDYVIKNIIDTSEYSYGRFYYLGTNVASGTVTGNIVNIVKAGANGKGSFSGWSGSAGKSAAIGGAWSTAFGTGADTGKVDKIAEGLAEAKKQAAFQLYGNITNVIRSGCVSSLTEEHYFRGAGWGYVEGNAYTEVGTEGIVYKEDYKDYSYSNSPVFGDADNNQGHCTAFDLAGGGGSTSGDNTFCIVGDTTLVQRHVLARWTYGGLFGGVHIGNSLNKLYKGIVDTVEGAGYNAYIQVGDSRAEIHGGEVDFFLAGGGWNDKYHDGNVSVEVFDAPDIYINCSMGGTYGASVTHYTSGDATIVVRGGDFSGSAGHGAKKGFSAGPSNMGTIFGNTSVTVDLRGNTHGFALEKGDSISGGRRHGVGSDSYLGTNESNTIELNILTDDASADLLKGLNIYGDCSGTHATIGNTRAGHITININAPNANLGNIFATDYSNLMDSGMSQTLCRSVEINLVSAGTINGLSAVGDNETMTNAIAANSASVNKYAVINIGPQSNYPDDLLGDKETEPTTNGLPHTISVVKPATGRSIGIRGFTSMDIKKRLLVAETGSIKNGGGATETTVTADTHRTDYNAFGNLILHAGEGGSASGLGIGAPEANAVFIVGSVRVVGEGTAYVQSPGKKDQIVFTDISTDDGSLLTWLKVGNTAPAANLQTNWFGAGEGWPVITFNPVKNNAEKLTPENFRGLETGAGKAFVGDSDTHFTAPAADGYAAAISASVYTWEVTEGQGLIAHNVEGVHSTKAVSGYIDIYSNVAANTPSRQGVIAVPSSKVPGTAVYSRFSFIPDAETAEWVKAVQIHRSDEYVTSPQHQNCTDIAGQSIPDYDAGVERTLTWTPAGDDKYYSFAVKAQFMNDAQIEGQNVIITESEAAGIAGAADVIAYNQAQGRPFFDHSITDDLLEAVRQPLAEGDKSRIHPVTYQVGIESLPNTTGEITVNIVVVKDGTVLSDSRSYAVYANDARIQLTPAQAIGSQADLDSQYTHAIAILADGTTAIPDINDGAVSEIAGNTVPHIPNEVSVSYAYAPTSELPPVIKNVTVTVVDDFLDFVFYKVGKNKSALSGVEFELYPRDTAGDGWDVENARTAVSGAEGRVELANLPRGDYMLTELKTASGYALPSGQWRLSIDTSAKKVTITAIEGTSPPAFACENGKYTLANYKVYAMPQAGGKGAIAFTVGGTALVGLAIILGISGRRKPTQGIHS